MYPTLTTGEHRACALVRCLHRILTHHPSLGSTYAWQDLKVDLSPEGVAVVTLDRPGKMNAFTVMMCCSIVFAFELFDADERVKVAIITGANGVFCAGADLAGGFAGGATYAQEHRDGGGQTGLAILRCRKPTIAAINGNAVGIGMTLTLSCDYRLVAEDAKVAIPFTKRGIAMEACSSYLLPRLIGVTKTMDIILSGDTRKPTDWSYMDLWSRPPMPKDQVLPTALQLAKTLSTQNSTLSMALCKAQIWRSPNSPEEAHLLESQGIWETSQKDAFEGIKSFLEKRPPKFEGTVSDLERFAFYPWWTEANVAGKTLRGPPPKAKM